MIQMRVDVTNAKNKQQYPLLLTGTIDSRPFDGDGIDLKYRLESYENSIKRYICDTKFNPIVFIENSGYDFEYEKYEKLAQEYGKQFEFINGTVCNKEVKEHGKGYGDSLLIYEGLTKSKLLANVENFYKITGRIFLMNSDEIISTFSKHRNEFISYDGMGWVITYIFKANKSDYLKIMKDVYLQCNDSTRRDMEICFWLRLYDSNLDIGAFKTYPLIDGKMGVSDKPYTKGKLDTMFRNLGIKLGIFTMKSKPSKCFWKMYQVITRRASYANKEDIK